MFGFNPLPSKRKENDGPPSLTKESQLRQQKIEISSMQDKLESEVKRLELEWQRSGDESVQV